MRHILTQILTVCYLSDDSLTQPLLHCNRSSQNLYRTTHIVTNSITFYYRSITFWHISHQISLRIKLRLDISEQSFLKIRSHFITDPITFYYRSERIFFKDPNTFCKQRVDMGLWNSGNGCFDAIWVQLCIPALFSIVEFCTLQVPMHKGLFFRINSDSEEARGSPW
jgi:hypothetical protein